MKLEVSVETFFDMLPKLISSGVRFEAVENGDLIIITFTGGF